MAEDMRITNLPDSGSTQRVAHDLMIRISGYEQDVKKDRSYWLTLYSEARSVVVGNAPR